MKPLRRIVHIMISCLVSLACAGCFTMQLQKTTQPYGYKEFTRAAWRGDNSGHLIVEYGSWLTLDALGHPGVDPDGIEVFDLEPLASGFILRRDELVKVISDGRFMSANIDDARGRSIQKARATRLDNRSSDYHWLKLGGEIRTPRREICLFKILPPRAAERDHVYVPDTDKPDDLFLAIPRAPAIALESRRRRARILMPLTVAADILTSPLQAPLWAMVFLFPWRY